MLKREFSEKLSHANTPYLLACLAEEVIEDALDKKDGAVLDAFVEQISQLLDAGLDPNVKVEETSCIYCLQYGDTDRHLDAAKMIFERCGLPSVTDDEGLTFFNYIRSKLDYNYYDCEYIVKLYLLCCAYTQEETYIRFSENLCAEMFDPSRCYTSASDDNTPISLSTKIFKDIHRFDFCVEMLPQEKGYYGCWRLHIFDKESKIEIATYY